MDHVSEIWVATEIEFKATVAVTDFNDAVLDVTFTNRKTGTSLTMPGFWDGGTAWKVRFAPTECGIWDFKTKASGKTDIGIDGITGTVSASEYTGGLEIYKRGFLKTEKGVRYFMYADGTPFFYLGDTHWTMPLEEFDSAGDHVGNIQTDSHFKYIVDRRVAQGFTVYQSEPLQAKYNVADGKISEQDILGFKDLDRYFKYIAEKGLVHANAELGFPSLAGNEPFRNNVEALTRYWVARYGAYPVMWTLAQECDDATYFSEKFPVWQTYIEMCRVINDVDPYRHPLSAHQINARDVTAKGGVRTRPIDFGTGDDRAGTEKIIVSRKSKFYGLNGHTWWANQWRPLVRMQYNFDIPRDYWENGEGKPIVDYEPSYHYLIMGDFGVRAQAWISYLSGMCGHGYGCADMWYYKGAYQADTDSSDGIETITSAMKKNAVWSDFINASISIEFTILKDFFESIAWWRLVPDFDNGNAFRQDADGRSFYAAAYDKDDIYVVYLYNRTVDSAGKLVNMDDGAIYTARWFDTRTGRYTLIDESIKPVDGQYVIPLKPIADDMVLLVTKNSSILW